MGTNRTISIQIRFAQTGDQCPRPPTFVLLCVVIYLISTLVPATRPILGVHDTWNTFRVLQYPSLITHILAHSSYDHLRGNMTHLLLTGPAVEHIFGSFNLVLILLVVAIVSALVHICVGKANTYQLGASGVVFACILLNSLVSANSGKIPVAFVITTTLYLGDELWKFVFPTDNVSHHAHLTGGLVGAVAGFYIHQKRRKAKSDTLANKYLKVMMQGIQKKTATKKKK